MKTFLYVLSWFLYIIGMGCVLAGAILQTIFSIKIYGFVFQGLIIKHWSIWLYLGLIPWGIGYLGIMK